MKKKNLLILFLLIILILLGFYYINNNTFNFSSSWGKNSLEKSNTTYIGSISVKESRKLPGAEINVNATNRIVINSVPPWGGNRGMVGVVATTPGIGWQGIYLNPVSRMNHTEIITYFWENLYQKIPEKPLEDSVFQAGIIAKDRLEWADVHNLEMTKITKIKETNLNKKGITPKKIHVFQCQFELRGVKKEMLVSIGKTHHEGDIIIGVTLTKPLNYYNITRQYEAFVFKHPTKKPIQ